MPDFKIDKNVPRPPMRDTSEAFSALLRRMEKDDSIFVPLGTSPSRASVYALARHAGVAITRRDEVLNGVEGFRIWRVDERESPRGKKGA